MGHGRANGHVLFYGSAEQARGLDAREAADVDTLGVLLAELALGERSKTDFPLAGADGSASADALLREFAEEQ
jgi:hypothetical protein